MVVRICDGKGRRGLLRSAGSRRPGAPSFFGSLIGLALTYMRTNCFAKRPCSYKGLGEPLTHASVPLILARPISRACRIQKHIILRVILSVAPGGSARAGRDVEGSPISGGSAGVTRATLRAVSQIDAHSPTAAKPPVTLEILQLRSAPSRPAARSTPFRMTRGGV